MPARVSKALAASLARTPADPKRSKHLNVKTPVGDLTFDSKKEAARYCELRVLQSRGLIAALELQPKFPLEVNGVVVAKYIGDFKYIDHLGRRVVEDVKSPYSRKLPVYRLKAKMFAAQYGFEIREV